MGYVTIHGGPHLGLHVRRVKLRRVKLRRVKHAEGLTEECPAVERQHDHSGSLEQSVRYRNHTGWNDIAVGNSKRQRRFFLFTTLTMRQVASSGKGVWTAMGSWVRACYVRWRLQFCFAESGVSTRRLSSSFMYQGSSTLSRSK